MRDRTWPRSVSDKSILAEIEHAGLAPNAAATRGALIRRLTYDLIGLPPAPDEVNEFVTDTDPQAYEKLVDRLLAGAQRCVVPMDRLCARETAAKTLPRSESI